MITFFSSIEANAGINASKNVKAVGFDDIFTRKVKHFGPSSGRKMVYATDV